MQVVAFNPDLLDRYVPAYFETLRMELTHAEPVRKDEIYQQIDEIAMAMFDLLETTFHLYAGHLGRESQRFDFNLAYTRFLQLRQTLEHQVLNDQQFKRIEGILTEIARFPRPTERDVEEYIEPTPLITSLTQIEPNDDNQTRLITALTK